MQQNKIDLRDFEIDKILNRNDDKKELILLGKLKGNQEPALVILEKNAFPDDDKLTNLISMIELSKMYFQNDIYSRHTLDTKDILSEVDAHLVYPVPEKLIKKYSKKNKVLINETYEFYKEHTYPTLVKASEGSHQWIYNALNKEATSEKFALDDPNPETGFILIHDIGFTNDSNFERLHLLAIVYRKDIQTLRDLNETHLPMLENIYNKSRQCIKEKFNADPNQIRAYVHYQPTYYHFHVHFSHIAIEGSTVQIEKAHSLYEIIQNIKLKGDYYQKVNIEFMVDTEHPLYKIYQNQSI